jgi:hypothetical protein
MIDPNLRDFYGRLARIKRARAKGFGFEAPGTLGRSACLRPVARRRSVLGPVLFLLFCGFLLKGAMYHQVGADLYNTRIANLRAGQGVEPVGGWLMQADPVTIYVADQIAALRLKMR